jgi:hypothetical protein
MHGNELDLAALAPDPKMHHALTAPHAPDAQPAQFLAAHAVIEQGGQDGAIAHALERVTGRRLLTELAFDPVNQPTNFQSHLWRYPVRLDIAIEYLGLSAQEFAVLFGGIMPGPCSADAMRPPVGAAEASEVVNPLAAGVIECLRQNARNPSRLGLPEFLKCACLTYCEFFEAWQSGFVTFFNGAARDGKFPECEPCCLDDLWLDFPEGQRYVYRRSL